MADEGVLYGDAPVPTLPLAVMLSERGWRRAASTLAAVTDLLERVAGWALSDEQVRELWRLTEPEIRAVALSAGDERLGQVIRYDVMVSAGRLQVIEVNAQFSGLASSDGIAECARDVGILPDDWMSRTRLVLQTPALARLLGGRMPTALVGHVDAPIAAEYRYTIKRLRTLGVDAYMAPVSSICLSSGPNQRLVVDGRCTEAVYVRGTYSDWWDAPQAFQALAAGSHAARLVNPLGSLLIDSKAALAALHHPLITARLSAAERALVRRHIPATFWVDADDCPGARTALSARRPSLVLKPVDGYGGDGVVLGSMTEQSRWDVLLRGHGPGHRRLVVQDVVPSWKVSVPTGRGGNERSFHLCLGLTVVNGELVGGFGRGSRTHLVNIAQGGGLLPLYVADKERAI